MQGHVDAVGKVLARAAEGQGARLTVWMPAAIAPLVAEKGSIAIDIDLLVEFGSPVGVFHLFSVQHRIEEILGVPEVDLVQRGAVHPALRERIYRETVNVA